MFFELPKKPFFCPLRTKKFPSKLGGDEGKINEIKKRRRRNFLWQM